MFKNFITDYIRSIVDSRLDQRLEAGIDVGTGTTSIRDDRVHISEAVPAVQLEGTETNGENLSIRENGGAIELYDETTGTVEARIAPDRFYMEGSTPGVQLNGTETGAENLTLRENAGAIELYDEAAATVVSSWNLNPALENASLAQVDQSRDLQPEGEQTGLAADSTGIKYEGEMRQNVDSWLLNDERSIYIEAATNSSAGDETVTVEVYDDTAAAVADSFTISGGSPRARSADISGSLTAGNEVHVRWNVTTASGTSGATFDGVGARLVVE